MPPDPTFHTPAYWEEKAKARPPGYLAELESARLPDLDRNGMIAHDRAHPAWLAAVEKYRTAKKLPRPNRSSIAHGAARLAKAVIGIDRADDATIERRRGICGTCDHNVGKLLSRCALCGCALRAKTTLKGEKCPAGKWMPQRP